MNKQERNKIMLFKVLGIILLAGGLFYKYLFASGNEVWVFAVTGAVLYTYSVILMSKALKRAKRDREAEAASNGELSSNS